MRDASISSNFFLTSTHTLRCKVSHFAEITNFVLLAHCKAIFSKPKSDYFFSNCNIIKLKEGLSKEIHDQGMSKPSQILSRVSSVKKKILSGKCQHIY